MRDNEVTLINEQEEYFHSKTKMTSDSKDTAIKDALDLWQLFIAVPLDHPTGRLLLRRLMNLRPMSMYIVSRMMRVVTIVSTSAS